MPQNLPFPEGDAPSEKSDSLRTLQKINQILYNLYALMGGGGGSGSGLTLTNWLRIAGTTSGSINTAAVFAPQTYFTRAIFSVPSTAGANVSIGPDNNADLYSLTPGETFLIQMPPGEKGDLNTWYQKSSSASQPFRIAYVL